MGKVAEYFSEEEIQMGNTYVKERLQENPKATRRRVSSHSILNGY